MPDILIVDDIRLNIRMLTTILSEQGYTIRTAQTGMQALSAIEAKLPDLILLDIMMPDMSGYDVCQAIKKHPYCAAIPIIFMSALQEANDIVKAFQVGGVDYIIKPFRMEEVVVRVQTHMTVRSLQQQLEAANNELKAINRKMARQIRRQTTELSEADSVYERFVPKEIVSLLEKKNIRQVGLGDQIQQNMVVMFIDIRSFTTLSENMAPQENFNFLNSYLGRVSPVIRQHNGFIDKYIGDAIMALFPHHVEDAMDAAITLQDAVRLYNKHRQNSGYETISIGIGIHYGSLMLGIIGEAERLQGTVISDVVNVAARLEGLTKVYGAKMIVSKHTLDALPDPTAYQVRFLDTVQVKGKQQSLQIFELLDGLDETIRTKRIQTLAMFEEGLSYYQATNFRQALKVFKHVLTIDPDDAVVQLYSQRATRNMIHGVPDNWQGIETFTHK